MLELFFELELKFSDIMGKSQKKKVEKMEWNEFFFHRRMIGGKKAKKGRRKKEKKNYHGKKKHGKKEVSMRLFKI